MAEFQLHQHEKIIMTVRKHPLILIGSLIPFAILDYLPYLLPELGKFLERMAPESIIPWAEYLSFGNPWVSFIVGIYWIFLWMAAFGVLTNHFLDQWIITNERVVDIDQKDFWSREVSSVLLARVQDVSTDISGFFQTLFGFGTITVESAGAEVNRMRMPGLSNPRHIRDLILKEAQRARKEEFNPHDT
jgi:hypothetical protein